MGNSRRNFHRAGKSGVLAVIFKYSRRIVHHHGRMMGFCPEGASYLVGHIHSVATLVIEDNSVSPGGHSTIHAKGRCGVRNCAVVAVYAKA